MLRLPHDFHHSRLRVDCACIRIRVAYFELQTLKDLQHNMEEDLAVKEGADVFVDLVQTVVTSYTAPEVDVPR